MLCSLSNLDDSDLKAIQDMENRIQKPLLAFSCQDLGFAELTSDELANLKELEKRLGLSLVAVEKG